MPAAGFISAFSGAPLSRRTAPASCSRRQLAPLPVPCPRGRRVGRPGVRMQGTPVSDDFARQLKVLSAETKGLLHGCPLYFVGCMGCGKSAVARYAAHELGYRFLDTDELAEGVTGRSVSEVFASEGEEAFRDLESAVLDQVQAWRGACIATGGGVVLRDMNWGKMQTGVVVWLDVDPAVLARRLDGDGSRPLLAGCASVEEKEEKLRGILEGRRARYELADVRVPVEEGEVVDEISAEVFRRVSNFIKENPPRFKSVENELYPKDTPRPPPPAAAGG